MNVCFVLVLINVVIHLYRLENVGRESFDGLRDDHHNSVSSPNDRHSPICASEESHQEGVSLSLSTNAVPSITAAHDKASLAG